MPDPKKLDPKKRAALLGCIAARNKKWSKQRNGKKPPASVSRKHFSECSKSTGTEGG